MPRTQQPDQWLGVTGTRWNRGRSTQPGHTLQSFLFQASQRLLAKLKKVIPLLPRKMPRNTYTKTFAFKLFLHWKCIFCTWREVKSNLFFKSWSHFFLYNLFSDSRSMCVVEGIDLKLHIKQKCSIRLQIILTRTLWFLGLSKKLE